MDRKAVYDEYCDRMLSYLSQEKVTDQMDNRIYSRELVEFLRNANKEFKITPCPLTDQQLSDYRVDKATMLPAGEVVLVNRKKTRYTGLNKNDNRDCFCPAWAPTASIHQKKGYDGRQRVTTDRNMNRNNEGVDRSDRNQQSWLVNQASSSGSFSTHTGSLGGRRYTTHTGQNPAQRSQYQNLPNNISEDTYQQLMESMLAFMGLNPDGTDKEPSL